VRARKGGPAGEGADESLVASADHGAGEHSERSVLEALVDQGLRNGWGLSVQQRADRLRSDVSRTEASAPCSSDELSDEKRRQGYLK
jgi:hypothetical protein